MYKAPRELPTATFSIQWNFKKVNENYSEIRPALQQIPGHSTLELCL